VSNEQQEPQQEHEHEDDNAIRGHGPGGVNFQIPIRRDDMRFIVYALAIAIVVLAVFFGWSLVK